MAIFLAISDLAFAGGGGIVFSDSGLKNELPESYIDQSAHDYSSESMGDDFFKRSIQFLEPIRQRLMERHLDFGYRSFSEFQTYRK